ncbi:MAG: zf-HC2 domain-containing protein [bacterium]|nr:zf-HC2 domain-containing protein [bacterium]
MKQHDSLQFCIDEAAGSALLHYALGTLSGDEKARFEEHLIECPACQSELENHKLAIEKLSTDRPAILATLNSQSKPSNEGPRRTLIWRTVVVAVAASIVALIWWPATQKHNLVQDLEPDTVAYNTQKADTGVSNHTNRDSTSLEENVNPSIAQLAVFTPLNYSPSRTRSSESDARELFRQGMESYAAGNYVDAIEILQRAQVADTTDTEIALFTGISAGISKDFSTAKMVLGQALRQKPRPTRTSQLTWYLSQASIALEDRATATMLLQELANGSSTYRDIAHKLLLEIN